MKRATPPPRRSSRARKPNQFLSNDTWVRHSTPDVIVPAPTPQSPKPTTPPSSPPSAPQKKHVTTLFKERITRKSPPSSMVSLSRPFSFATRSGNAREVIELTDDDDPTISMSDVALREKMRCQICTTKMRTHVFMPCGHFVACTACAEALTSRGTCAFCREPIASSTIVKFC